MKTTHDVITRDKIKEREMYEEVNPNLFELLPIKITFSVSTNEPAVYVNNAITKITSMKDLLVLESYIF